jgi:hypothetical protein
MTLQREREREREREKGDKLPLLYILIRVLIHELDFIRKYAFIA